VVVEEQYTASMEIMIQIINNLIMKKIQSTIENQFYELREVVLTKEEKIILFSNDFEAKKLLYRKIEELKKGELTQNEIDTYTQFYLSIKPVLNSNEIYDFVSLDLTDNNGTYVGILNYRVNEEHKQIRF